MNRDDEAHLAVEHARDALRENRRSDARRWAERAAELAPETEDPWLILAAIASPNVSLRYIQRALKINPKSVRARRGMEWAMRRLSLRQAETADTRQSPARSQPAMTSQPPDVQPAPAASAPAARPAVKGSRPSAATLVLVGIGLLVCLAAGISAAMSPMLASIVQQVEPPQSPSWALAIIPKPTYAPASPLAMELAPTVDPQLTPAPLDTVPTGTVVPTDEVLQQPTEAPTGQPTDASTGQPAQETPTAEPTLDGSLTLTYVDGVPTPADSIPTTGGGQHWIDVNLTQQTLYAYEGDTVVNSFLVSTGTWLHPTVTGQYHVYVKLRYTDMIGPDYYLPNVPYTMYFYQSYGLHGTYWHHNFGTPMSHGCVNLSIPDSEWLYNFSSVGTLVNIHY
ncbi:MAG TPA: L,D-transpeptidase family protein [Anaerolineales bacterium]